MCHFIVGSIPPDITICFYSLSSRIKNTLTVIWLDIFMPDRTGKVARRHFYAVLWREHSAYEGETAEDERSGGRGYDEMNERDVI